MMITYDFIYMKLINIDTVTNITQAESNFKIKSETFNTKSIENFTVRNSSGSIHFLVFTDP